MDERPRQRFDPAGAGAVLAFAPGAGAALGIPATSDPPRELDGGWG